MNDPIYSKVFLRFHWGFSVVEPLVAKAKLGLYLPPPSSLIGALSYGKFRGIDNINLGEIHAEQDNKRRGKKGRTDSNLGASPAYNFRNIKSTARLETKLETEVAGLEIEGAYAEDIIRNVISYFQRKSGGRRSDPKYIYGVVPTGKVYMPNGILVVVYLTDSMSEEELEKLSWSITRIGAKECLVSVEKVEIGEAKKVSGRIRTKYYFRDTVKVVENQEFLEHVTFWDDNGYIWGREGNKVGYYLPIRIYPLASEGVEVEAKEAYEVGGEYVVFD
ncbi:MAG: type I-A CRISPR-associated protein Cas5a [Caldisphaera sp.]